VTAITDKTGNYSSSLVWASGGYDRTHGDRSVHQLAVIEDCAQSTGAEMDGVALTHRLLSFYPTRICGDGDGGL